MRITAERRSTLLDLIPVVWCVGWLVFAGIETYSRPPEFDSIDVAPLLALTAAMPVLGMIWRNVVALALAALFTVAFAAVVGFAPCPPHPTNCQHFAEGAYLLVFGTPIALALTGCGWLAAMFMDWLRRAHRQTATDGR